MRIARYPADSAIKLDVICLLSEEKDGEKHCYLSRLLPLSRLPVLNVFVIELEIETYR